MTVTPPTFVRDYSPLRSKVSVPPDRDARMKFAVDVLWDAFGGDGPDRGISWIGFYLPDGEEMILSHRRDKPACSPIGLHGMCGKSYLDQTNIIVDDVATLGDNYVACDPRDLSELVIPLFEDDGTCWGVLDVDSFDKAAFHEHDIEPLTNFMRTLGLTTTQSAPVVRL